MVSGRSQIARATLACAALACIALACASSPTAPTAELTAAPIPKVELLSPGSAPLRLLRLAPKAGARELMTLTAKMGTGMNFEAGKGPPVMAMPPIVLTCELVATEPAADGTFEMHFTILAAAADPDPAFPIDLAVALASAVEPLVGLKGWSRMNDRGITLASNIGLSPNADPATRQLVDNLAGSLTQLGAPLPLEAVGVGARWRVVRELEGDARIRQTTMVELTELVGVNATLRLDISQTAARQRIKAPGLPATTVVELVSLEGEGDAEIAIDLGKLVPDASHLDMRTLVKALVTGDDQKLPLALGTTLSVDIAPR